MRQTRMVCAAASAGGALALSALRCALFVDPATGYDNGPLAAVCWVAALLLAAVGCLLFVRETSARAWEPRPLGRGPAMGYLAAGLLLLAGSVVTAAAGGALPTAAAAIAHGAASLLGVGAGLALLTLGACTLAGGRPGWLPWALLLVPAAAIARTLRVFTATLLNGADTIRVLSLGGMIVAAYGAVRLFFSLLVEPGESPAGSAALPVAAALCLCALALPTAPLLWLRGSPGEALSLLGDIALALAGFFALLGCFTGAAPEGKTLGADQE